MLTSTGGVKPTRAILELKFYLSKSLTWLGAIIRKTLTGCTICSIGGARNGDCEGCGWVSAYLISCAICMKLQAKSSYGKWPEASNASCCAVDSVNQEEGFGGSIGTVMRGVIMVQVNCSNICFLDPRSTDILPWASFLTCHIQLAWNTHQASTQPRSVSLRYRRQILSRQACPSSPRSPLRLVHHILESLGQMPQGKQGLRLVWQWILPARADLARTTLIVPSIDGVSCRHFKLQGSAHRTTQTGFRPSSCKYCVCILNWPLKTNIFDFMSNQRIIWHPSSTVKLPHGT